jgi:hypothetical protein
MIACQLFSTRVSLLWPAVRRRPSSADRACQARESSRRCGYLASQHHALLQVSRALRCRCMILAVRMKSYRRCIVGRQGLATSGGVGAWLADSCRIIYWLTTDMQSLATCSYVHQRVPFSCSLSLHAQVAQWSISLKNHGPHTTRGSTASGQSRESSVSAVQCIVARHRIFSLMFARRRRLHNVAESAIAPIPILSTRDCLFPCMPTVPLH